MHIFKCSFDYASKQFQFFTSYLLRYGSKVMRKGPAKFFLQVYLLNFIILRKKDT